MKLFVATPAYNSLVTTPYVNSLLGLFNVGVVGGWSTTSDALVSQGRNTLVARFLASGFEHMLFIDADIAFDPQQIVAMGKFDQEFVAGAYPQRQFLAGGQLGYTIKLCNPVERDASGRFIAAEKVGAGLMLLKRSVFEKMTEAYPERKYKHDTGETHYAFFDPTLVDGGYLSEDTSFCRFWRALGGAIWVDTEGKVAHVGQHTFQGQGLKYLQDQK